MHPQPIPVNNASQPAIAGERVRKTLPVLGAEIDVLTMPDAVATLSGWAARRQSRYVCICNVHSVVTASRDTAFRGAINGADLATPDGAPVAWFMRKSGAPQQRRLSGPDLMEAYFAHAERNGESVFLLGSTEATLRALVRTVSLQWPALRVAGTLSPPFRPLSPEEDESMVAEVNASGAGTVWISLGCPKQELWMAAHRGRIHAPMIGVGAAFDFLAGTVQRAPRWMRKSGLEWLHRLASEPRRLWRRYLVTNSLFIAAVMRELARRRR